MTMYRVQIVSGNLTDYNGETQSMAVCVPRA